MGNTAKTCLFEGEPGHLVPSSSSSQFLVESDLFLVAGRIIGHAVLDLSLAWDLPGPTSETQKWLFERLLTHAMLLSCICWPSDSSVDDDDDEDCSLEDRCRISGYLLRQHPTLTLRTW